MEKFHDKKSDDKSLVKGKTWFEVDTDNAELSDIVRKIERCDPVEGGGRSAPFSLCLSSHSLLEKIIKCFKI